MNDPYQKQRRQRAILSCNDCRRRKLKCDRLSPCNRCIKRGIAASCAYGSDAHNSTPEPLHGLQKRKLRSTHDQSSITIEESSYPHKSTEQLEYANTSIHHEQDRKDQVEFLATSPDLKGINKQSFFMGMLKGHGYGTHFYGPSSQMSVIAHFPDLRILMKEAYGHSPARRLSQDIKASEDQARAMSHLHRFLSIPNLRSLLPDRSTVDSLLNQYFATFETTLRIIHVPTFKNAYEDYWTGVSDEDVDMDAIILSILACTICTSTHSSPRYNHSGSSFRTKAVVWIKACEVWLKRQSGKHRSLASLQVRCLRIIALATTSLKVKEYYQEVQAHVAFMQSCGMHRDPSIFGTRCSLFEGEMRRRLWATTVELELQASVDKGISSIIRSADYDCAPPRNIDDIELTLNLEELPRSHGITTFTNTTFVHLASQTLELRAEVFSKTNNLKDKPDIYDIFEYEDSLRKHIANIPHWNDPKSLQSRVLLDLQLRQCLLALHGPRALQADSRGESNHRYSMVTTLEAAATTIELYSSLDMSENHSLTQTRNDYFRAILLICHITYHAKKADDTIMMRLAKQIFDESFEKALHLQGERAMRSGRGTQYFWYVSAAVSLVGMQFKPSQAENFKRQAVDRVAKLLHKTLALFDDPTAESLATEIILGNAPNSNVSVGGSLYGATGSLVIDPFAGGQGGLDAFDIDASEWMMDDLWFLNGPDMTSNLDPILDL